MAQRTAEQDARRAYLDETVHQLESGPDAGRWMVASWDAGRAQWTSTGARYPCTGYVYSVARTLASLAGECRVRTYATRASAVRSSLSGWYYDRPLTAAEQAADDAEYDRLHPVYEAGE